MSNDTIVWWSTKQLSKEFGLSTSKIGKLLKAIGAKRWSKSPSSNSTTWYYDSEEKEQ